jgi:hypothetical protein
MGLAGIGGPQHGGDAGAAGTRRSVGLRGKGDGHHASNLFVMAGLVPAIYAFASSPGF